MRIQDSRLRWLKDIVISIVLMVIGLSVCWRICALPMLALIALPFSGGFGGDCPELLSYGSITVAGIVLDSARNPVQGVQIHIRKEDGLCPQSIAFDEIVTSDADGSFNFLGALHLGDPEIYVEISADGYGNCQFSYRATATQSATINLEIRLNRILDVQGNVTQFWVGEDSLYERDLPSCS
jgi:hypothetical protein